MALATLIILLAFVYFAVKCLVKGNQHLVMYKTISSVKGPNEFSLVGVALKVVGFEAMFNYLMNLTDIYGSPAKFWYGPASLVVMIDMPEDIKLVLNSENCLNKAPFYNFLNTGKALIAAEKEMWKIHIKILSRAFNKNLLESSIPVINEESKNLVKSLSDKTDGDEFDILQSIVPHILKMIFKNFLDMEWNEQITNEYIENSKK